MTKDMIGNTTSKIPTNFPSAKFQGNLCGLLPEAAKTIFGYKSEEIHNLFTGVIEAERKFLFVVQFRVTVVKVETSVKKNSMERCLKSEVFDHFQMPLRALRREHGLERRMKTFRSGNRDSLVKDGNCEMVEGSGDFT